MKGLHAITNDRNSSWVLWHGTTDTTQCKHHPEDQPARTGMYHHVPCLYEQAGLDLDRDINRIGYEYCDCHECLHDRVQHIFLFNPEVRGQYPLLCDDCKKGIHIDTVLGIPQHESDINDEGYCECGRYFEDLDHSNEEPDEPLEGQ
jgi:hypothetical protein